jgi:lysophospholipase L1-like esterase
LFVPLKRRTGLGYLTLLLLGVVSGLVTAEVLLRLRYSAANCIYQSDDVLLFKLVPGSHKIFSRAPGNGGDKIPIRINSQGFRGDELSASSGDARVVVYGDSLIEAEFSSLENTFVQQLQLRLEQQRGTRVQVINAGVVGYGPDQVLLKMERELKMLHPDLTIVTLFTHNDFGDLVRNRIFSLDEHGELLRNHYALNGLERWLLGHAAFPAGIYRLRVVQSLMRLAWIISESGHPGSGDYVDQALRQSYDEYRTAGSEHTAVGLFRDHYDADLAVAPDSASARYKLALMEGILRQMRAVTAARHVPLLLLIVPSPIDVCGSYDYAVDPKQYPLYRHSRLSDDVESIAERNGITYLNLFRPFSDANADDLYFRFGDDHWNDAGQRVAAELVSTFIVARGLF